MEKSTYLHKLLLPSHLLVTMKICGHFSYLVFRMRNEWTLNFHFQSRLEEARRVNHQDMKRMVTGGWVSI